MTSVISMPKTSHWKFSGPQTPPVYFSITSKDDEDERRNALLKLETLIPAEDRFCLLLLKIKNPVSNEQL
jgi:hypothetical protein